VLFKFGTFWQTISILIGTWICYGLADFEFTAITLLAGILILNFKNTTKS